MTSNRNPCAGGWIGACRPLVSLESKLSDLQSILTDMGGCERWYTSVFFRSVNLHVSLSQDSEVTFAIWGSLQNNWGKDFEFHFEVEMTRRGSVSTGLKRFPLDSALLIAIDELKAESLEYLSGE
jgi:hypothetical protein